MVGEEGLSAEIARARALHGPVCGIVHLAGLCAPVEIGDFARWRLHSSQHVKGFFRLLRMCSQDLACSDGGFVLAASGLGGGFGRDHAEGGGCATAGGAIGLLKTVAREWPGVRTRAVDFSLAMGPDRIASLVVAELRCGDDDAEIGYAPRGRFAHRTVAAPLAGEGRALGLDGTSVVMVTGGARGITAEVALALAADQPTMILVGRAPSPAPTESAATANAPDAAALRRHFIDRGLASATPPAPAQVEQQVATLLKEREIRSNLARLQARGARVEYVSLDLRDETACARLMDDVYRRHGRIDVFVHGAGIIEDRLIEDKQPDQFDRVFDTKADSSFALAALLRPETVRFCAFFTSVAGRFGNRGQCDYAAANETVNRLAWQLDRRWNNTRVVAINWGPWRSGGMASAEVLNSFAARGIVPIEPQAGCRSFVDELARGVKGDVEVILGEGPWQELDGSGPPQDLGPRVERPRGLPFVKATPGMFAGSTVTMQHVFTLQSDPYLLDHRLDHAPVVPLTVALEWLAEFVQAAWPRFHVVDVRELRVLKGIVLDGRNGKRAILRARSATHADAETVTVSAEIIDADRNRPSYTGTFGLSDGVPDATPFEIVPLRSRAALDVSRAYRELLFHGPRFHLLSAIESMDAQGIDAVAVLAAPADWLGETVAGDARAAQIGSWLFDPGLLDTAPQLAIIWSRLHNDVTAIPHRFGRLARFGKGPLIPPVRVAFRVRDTSNLATLAYDATFVDSSGMLRLRIEDAESACSAALNRLALQQP